MTHTAAGRRAGAVFALAGLEIRALIRQPVALFFGMVFPVLLLLIFGSLYSGLPLERGSDLTLVSFYVPALIAVLIGQAGFVSLPTALTAYRENGILRHYYVTPLDVRYYLLVHSAAQGAILVLSWLALAVVGAVVFDTPPPANPLLLAVTLAVSVLAFFAVGFALSGLFSSPQVSQTVGNFLFLTMFFLSGAVVPADAFPGVLQWVSAASPMTYAVESVSGAWLGKPVAEVLEPTAVMAGVAVVAAFIAPFTFKWRT